MAETFPITPEMVVDAFQETGLRAVQKVIGTKSCACGLGAMFAQRFGRGKQEGVSSRVFCEAFDLELDEFWSFVAGFDNCLMSGIPFTPAYYAGRRSAQLMGLIPADADGQEVGR